MFVAGGGVESGAGLEVCAERWVIRIGRRLVGRLWVVV